VFKSEDREYVSDKQFLKEWWMNIHSEDKREVYLWELIDVCKIDSVDKDSLDEEFTVMEGVELKNLLIAKKLKRAAAVLFYFTDQSNSNKYFILGLYHINYQREFPPEVTLNDLKEDLRCDLNYTLLPGNSRLFMFINQMEYPPIMLNHDSLCNLLRALYAIGTASEEEAEKTARDHFDAINASCEFELMFIWLFCSNKANIDLRGIVATSIERIYNAFRDLHYPYEHDVVRMVFKKNLTDYKVGILKLNKARQYIGSENVTYLESLKLNYHPRYIFSCPWNHASKLMSSHSAIIHQGRAYFIYSSVGQWLAGRWSESCNEMQLDPSFYWNRVKESIFYEIGYDYDGKIVHLEKTMVDIKTIKSVASSELTSSVWNNVPVSSEVPFVDKYYFFLPPCILNPLLNATRDHTHMKHVERKIVFRFLSHIGIPLEDTQLMWFEMCRNDPSLKGIDDYTKFITSNPLGHYPRDIYKWQKENGSAERFISCETMDSPQNNLCMFTDIEDVGTRKAACASFCNSRSYTVPVDTYDKVPESSLKFWSPRTAFKFQIWRAKEKIK
jgi:hypothetical protein